MMNHGFSGKAVRLAVRAALALFASASLLSLGGCGPSINAASKADIDRQIAALQAPSNSVPAPAAGQFRPMPLAPGQWAKFKIVNDEGQPSFYTYKVLGEEAGAYWVEVAMDEYRGKTLQKMLVFFGSRTDPKELEIRAVATKDVNGNVTELPRDMMPMIQNLYKSAVASLILSWEGLPQEDASAPAGSFDGCYKTRSKAQWGPWKSEADSWSHTAVPINGLVKSRGVDKKFDMDLAAYGLTGAKSEF
jgi:hypothetical protein